MSLEFFTPLLVFSKEVPRLSIPRGFLCFICLSSSHNQSLPSQNPILKNITDYLIEEVSAEEEELLGSSGGPPPEEPPKEGNPAEINVERDEKLIKVPVRAEFGMNKSLAWGGKGAGLVNSWLLISFRFWTNYSSIYALCIPWIIIIHASIPMKMKCPTVVESSMFGGPCHPTASVMEKVSSPACVLFHSLPSCL